VLPAKALECRLLLARIDTDRGMTQRARGHLAAAGRLLGFAQSPLLAGHTSNAAARIEEASGSLEEAAVLYERAQREFEQIRDRLGAEHLRISFFEDKLAAYESHFRLLFEAGRIGDAFEVAERAKARVLATAAAPRRALRYAANSEAMRLREESTALEKQLDAAQVSGRPVASIRARLTSARRALEQFEIEPETGKLTSALMEQLVREIPEDTALVEYFQSGAYIHAFVFEGGTVHARRICEAAPVIEQIRYLQFQMSRVTGPFAATFAKADPLGDALRHLRAMHSLLIRPIEPWLNAGHCVFIPHGALHSLPFQALHDGTSYLGELRTVSVAPSATLYLNSLSVAGSGRVASGSAVFGVADKATPHILEEATTVAAMTPNSSLFLNGEASMAQLFASSAKAAHLHIATHGTFRRDNPWFSALRMGDGELNLYDLYELDTPAELIVLSGCATGLSVVQGGDEPVGLIRGLLQAGARTALVSLWNVSDRSTTAFMRAFYRHSLDGRTLAKAVQLAQMEVARQMPHPFHWAAFSLVGWHGGMEWNK
jgi:CHAT domain-containing protein